MPTLMHVYRILSYAYAIFNALIGYATRAHHITLYVVILLGTLVA